MHSLLECASVSPFRVSPFHLPVDTVCVCLAGEEVVTRESFVSIAWRLVPYWLNQVGAGLCLSQSLSPVTCLASLSGCMPCFVGLMGPCRKLGTVGW